MNYRPFTDAEEATLRRMVEEGYSGEKIATALGRNVNSVLGRIRRMGLQLKGRSRRYSDEQEAAILEAYRAGEEIASICQRFGCDRNYPRKLGLQAGLPRREQRAAVQKHRKPRTDLWPAEDRDMLAKLLLDGLSASQIAARMGKSRSAIVGYVYRDKELRFVRGPRQRKLSAKPISIAEQRKKKVRGGKPNVTRLKAKQPEAAPAYVPVPPNEYDAASRRLTLMELEWRDCRWIVEGSGAEALFCGHGKLPGSSWCEHHFRRSVASPPFLPFVAEEAA